MAKNVQGVIFLRNGKLYENREQALQKIGTFGGGLGDGEAILARYTDTNDENKVKTIVGFKYVKGEANSLTIIDVEGLKGDAKALVEALRTEINNKLGIGVTSANTATAQLEALSGGTFTPGTSASGDTSVEGAKAYAYDLLGTLDYSGVTTGDGVYVTNVTQTDGVIAATTATLPSSADTAVAKNVVIAVSEDKGQITVSRGEITSSAETIVLTDNADGGINFEVNIDNASIVQDETTKKIKVADSALTQYSGDGITIQVSAADANNAKTISSLLTIEKVTTGLSEEVKEEYHLVGSDHVTIGEPVKIYKDSHIVSINYITDSGDTHYQNLEYVYVNASGVTSTTYVDMSELVLEAEFASGLTIENHVARGVVDPLSEKDSQDTPVDFLTVGADGFKVSGIKDEIDRKIGALTATESGNSSHVEVVVTQVAGKIVGVQAVENNIADADDLAELSAKTVTEITSTNGSITATQDDAADGTVTYDIETDASKIKMSGFTVSGTSSFSGIAESDSIADAFNEANAVITENERITAAALNDLDERLDEIESGYVGTVKVNDVALTETDHAVNVQISGSTAAATAINGEAIVVNTDQNTGAITLGIGYIDCGTYDDEE